MTESPEVQFLVVTPATIPTGESVESYWQASIPLGYRRDGVSVRVGELWKLRR